jgi:hypothetical protein
VFSFLFLRANLSDVSSVVLAFVVLSQGLYCCIKETKYKAYAVAPGFLVLITVSPDHQDQVLIVVMGGMHMPFNERTKSGIVAPAAKRLLSLLDGLLLPLNGLMVCCCR